MPLDRPRALGAVPPARDPAAPASLALKNAPRRRGVPAVAGKDVVEPLLVEHFQRLAQRVEQVGRRRIRKKAAFIDSYFRRGAGTTSLVSELSCFSPFREVHALSAKDYGT